MAVGLRTSIFDAPLSPLPPPFTLRVEECETSVVSPVSNGGVRLRHLHLTLGSRLRL